MSVLFQPFTLGGLTLKNRFMQSATVEGMATEEGAVTEPLIARSRAVAHGGAGLMIPGALYVHKSGRAVPHMTGIHEDALVGGLRALTDSVHEAGAKIAFQLDHAGRQTRSSTIGRVPMAPSSGARDQLYFEKPAEMTETEIQEMITSFASAARRAVQANVDGIQIKASHGYLVNEFLSPFFNKRTDGWGGSEEKRFRFLAEIVAAIRKEMPVGMPLLAKLNMDDHTPSEGIHPELACRYAKRLHELGLDGIEVSCGTFLYSGMHIARGEVPVSDYLRCMPWWARPVAHGVLKSWVGKYPMEEAYNLGGARLLRQELPKMALMLVGGMRTLSEMERIVEAGDADIISMSRPFVRQPDLVNRFAGGKAAAATCTSCNRCNAAYTLDVPLRCFSGAKILQRDKRVAEAPV